jgi:hypothetical protein
MTTPLSFSERLRALRQRKEIRAAVLTVASTESDNVLRFRGHFHAGLEDEPKGAVPWVDWLRAEPWVPVVED